MTRARFSSPKRADPSQLFFLSNTAVTPAVDGEDPSRILSVTLEIGIQPKLAPYFNSGTHHQTCGTDTDTLIRSARRDDEHRRCIVEKEEERSEERFNAALKASFRSTRVFSHTSKKLTFQLTFSDANPKPVTTIVVMVLKKFITILAVIASLAHEAGASSLPRVHAGVHRTLRAQGTVNLIVTMKDGTEKTLSSVKEAEFSSRGQQIASMVDSLEQSARDSQKVVASILSQEASTLEPLFASTTSFWISNQVFIEGATFELVEKLAQTESILELREEIVIPLRKPVVGASSNATSEATTEAIAAPTNPKWGVKKIQASDVWATGNLGQNINVGVIDTGVRSTHVALKDSFLGAYGWYDPEKKTADPYDPDGHGTHTTGTVAGGNGIGVAPGAKWLHCKGCRTDECTESDLLACAQFMTCPTNPVGTKKDCSKAPRVINNSWAGDQGDTFFTAAIQAWVTAGIIPVFANGNSGSACSTAESPGDVSNAITVGATDSTDTLADFSSRGPSLAGLLKPDISAPGVRVYSASWVDDVSYRYESGTSMAAPHVSGAIALLLSAKPSLTYAQVKSLLYATTDRSSLGATGQTCGGTADSKFPNNQYGYGRMNILAAINK